MLKRKLLLSMFIFMASLVLLIIGNGIINNRAYSSAGNRLESSVNYAVDTPKREFRHDDKIINRLELFSMKPSTTISIISLIFSIAFGFSSFWYTRKEYTESKKDTKIASKSNQDSETSNKISQRSNQIARDSINKSTERDKKKIAIKAVHVFYETIQPEIKKLNGSIDQFIFSHPRFRSKYGVDKNNITCESRILVQMYMSPKYVQSITNIIIDINDWSIDVISGMADMQIINDMLRLVLYNINRQASLVEVFMKPVDRKNYDTLMKSLRFK